jgi:hypothetical protein
MHRRILRSALPVRCAKKQQAASTASSSAPTSKLQELLAEAEAEAVV